MNRWVAGFILAAAIACALRFPQLESRPMHNDEAVNAIKFGALWENGEYQYDPHEYHGPTLHYFSAALCKLTGAPEFEQLSETRLRLLTALAGVALILLLPLVGDGLGRSGVVGAAFFTALSPMMVFFSRYWIHEMLLVLFTFLAISAAWRFIKKPTWTWAAITGMAIGLMQATKETFVFAIAAAAGAITLNWLWRKLSGPPVGRPQLPLKKLAAGIVIWLIVWATLFTSFFTHADGLLDSVRTYGAWLNLAGSESVHAHPWSFYFERLFWYHSPGKAFWSEGLILALAMVGGANAFRRGFSGEGSADFIRFLTFFTILLAAIYTVIPYKTPWCALGFLHGLILLAGAGAATLWRAGANWTARAAVIVVLALGMAHLGWQAWRANFPLNADRSNPWVYAHTSPDLLNLVEKVKAVTAAGEGDATLIKVMATEGDYWPLPWSLREFDKIGWWDAVPEDPAAPIVIASPEMKLRLDAQRTHVMAGYFQLRPQVFLELYVELGLWEKYLKR